MATFLEEGQEEHQVRMARLKATYDRLGDLLRQQDTDSRIFRNFFTLSAATHSLDIMIWDMMGGDLDATLNERELLGLFRNSGASDLPPNEVRSFVNADIVAKVVQPIGAEESYVAIEVSYTVQPDDVRRAVRNAEYLTRFTGLAALPAVAGVRLDDRVREDVESGAIYWWHAIAERELRAR